MGEGCVDIDECEEKIHDCFHFKDDHMYTECFNTDGGYECDCIDGWAETVTAEGGKKCELILRIVFSSNGKASVRLSCKLLTVRIQNASLIHQHLVTKQFACQDIVVMDGSVVILTSALTRFYSQASKWIMGQHQ